MSEAAGRDVGTTAATRSYIEQVLPTAPEPLDSGEPLDASELLEGDDSLASADE
jgi:hypothetical protein